MLSANICEHCGRVFPTIYHSQKYCSKSCRIDAKEVKTESEGQLCWRCKNACGGCSWSQHLIPIKGWLAKKSIIHDNDGDIRTYEIEFCPEFIEE